MDAVSRAQNAETAPKKVNGRPFPKGVSGNPGGRPKKFEITKIFEKILADPKNRKRIEQDIIAMLRERRMASVLLLREMAERTEGKVMQQVEMELSARVTLEQVLEARKKAGKE